MRFPGPGAARVQSATVLALALAGLVGLGACSSAPTRYPPPTPLPTQPGCVVAGEANALCILILGDSIAVGVPIAVDVRWWWQLQRQLEAVLPERVIAMDNWAISGSQIAVLESAVNDQPAVTSYDLAIVIEGVNDEHMMSAATWQPRYETAIATLEAKGLTVVVTAPPPSFENGAFGTRYDPFAAAVRDVATRGRPLLDIGGRWHADGPDLAGAYYADLIHQSAVGQDVMATMALDVVLDALGVEIAARRAAAPVSLG